MASQDGLNGSGPASLTDLLHRSRKLAASSARPSSSRAANGSGSSSLLTRNLPPASGPSSSQSMPSLAQSGSTAQLPRIELGLDQIEAYSRRLALKAVQNQPTSAQPVPGGDADRAGAYFLATGAQIDTDNLENMLSSLPRQLGRQAQPVNDTVSSTPAGDLPLLLQHMHEQSIVGIIELTRAQTLRDSQKVIDQGLKRSWDKMRATLWDELGAHQAATTANAQDQQSRTLTFESGDDSFSASTSRLGSTRRTNLLGQDESTFGNSVLVDPSTASLVPASLSGATPAKSGQLQMHSRMMKYDQAVRKLNEARKAEEPIGIIRLFADAALASSTGPSTDQKSAQLNETYSLMAKLLHETAVSTDGQAQFTRVQLPQGAYLKGYWDPDRDTVESRAYRHQIIVGGTDFLQDQFMRYVERMLAAKPTEANLGGVPSLQNKIRAFVSLRYSKMGQWTVPDLQLANNTPVWARIFFLLRAGHPQEALSFALENEQSIQKLERSFIPYFKAWLDSPDRRLPRHLRDRFLTEYQQKIRFSSESQDPFKYALYKLMGRSELSRRSVPGVTDTAEDWMWFQLQMIRESEQAEQESYTLQDLGALLVKYGEAHFDPKGSRPLLYFQLLLLSGNYERAVAFLYGRSQYQVDAVHFAIILAYYGLLRLPRKDQVSDVDLLTVEQVSKTQQNATLNFSRLIYRYYRLFARSDPTEALQYIYLICLNIKCPSPIDREQKAICYDYLRELVMDSKAYSQLLGDIRTDGSKVPGQIEKDLKLIGLSSNSDYLANIVRAAAAQADRERRFGDSILLFNLAEEYDAVLRVLNAELGASLSRPSSSAASTAGKAPNASTQFAVQEDPVGTAKSIIGHFEKSIVISSKISRRLKEASITLVNLKEAITLYEQDQLERALSIFEELNIVPLEGDMNTLIRRAEEFKQLDDAITRNFDVVILTVMNTLYKLNARLKESPYGDEGRQSKIAQMKRYARAVMTFSGMLRFALRSETYTQLTRLDVFLH
ncbi:uncharacterized protein L969DRAFT_95409 [Mixia osmundae IAM 14324]|uniref:Nuclear pore protein n=1 Tax=Mixia osmundae (strain CBS 9802 / IAM 14324 / JCM 22182 / KY 12970) TaxID=764103 RepID=G7E0F1_MIXOS|nr:uncharacterized protein L969DRAFT_95409 [Mixia osmundae IAM 14324]KEI38319.1 hypothetical protein L969DRAFT_95409 [Mixia osmundae IAM 14324]GAA96311.1 hypothetical protein E5Q_02977 [Mixia osmundae IAM 14324]